MAIVRAIVVLGHTLGLTVVAEGVEQKEQAGQLRQLGCDELQGYYFSRPLNALALAQWLTDGSHPVDRRFPPALH